MTEDVQMTDTTKDGKFTRFLLSGATLIRQSEAPAKILG